LGIGGNVWTSANDFINSTDPELLLTMLGVSLDPASYATGDGGYSGYQPDGSASDQNITIGSNILINLRDVDGDGIFDKVYYFGPGIEIDQSISSTEPITQTEEFLAWLEGNYGTEVPEVITDGMIDDYYDYLITEQENSILGASTGNGSNLTEAQKIALSASLATNLNTKIQSKYGTNSLQMPSVTYDKTKGGYATFVNGVIYTNDAFFNLLNTDGDRMSTLMHEYTHYKDNILGINNPVKNDDGQITSIRTGVVPTRTTEEYKAEYDVLYRCNKAIAEPGETDNVIKMQTNADMQRPYTYRCSNYWKDEMAARQAELQGEKDGFYVMSDNYRERQTANIELLKIFVDRALKYEKDNGFKPNGSPK